MLEREKQMDELTSDLRRLKDQLSIANRRAEAAERDLKGAKAFQPKIKPKPQNELGVDGQGMGVSKKEMDDKIKAFGEEMKKEWEAKVKKLEQRLEKATNDVKAERNRALDLTTEIEELKAQVAAFEGEKAERELLISQRGTEAVQAEPLTHSTWSQVEIDYADSDTQTVIKEFAETETQCSLLEEELERMRSEVEACQATEQAAEEEAGELRGELKRTKTELGDKIKEQAEEIAGLKGRLEAEEDKGVANSAKHEGSVESLKGELKRLEDEMFELRSKKGKLEEVIQGMKVSHQSKVDDLDREIRERGGKIGELEAEVEKLGVKISNLEENKAALETEVSGLNQEVESRNERITAVEEEILEARNETLQARDDRTEALSKMEEANATMQGVVKSLEEEIDTRRGLQLEWGETKQDLVERVQLAREAVSDILSQHAELKQKFLGKWEESGERASSIERDLLDCQKEKLEAEDRIRVLEREAEEMTEKGAGMEREIADQKEKIGNLDTAIEAKDKELDVLRDKLHSESQAHAEAKTQLITEHAQEKSEMDTKHTRQKNELEERHTKSMNDLEDKHSKTRRDLEEKHAKATQDLETKYAKNQKDAEEKRIKDTAAQDLRHEKHVEDIEAKHAKVVQGLEDKATQQKDEATLKYMSYKSDSEANYAQLKADSENRFAKAVSQHASDKAEMEAHYQGIIAEANSRHSQQVSDQQAAHTREKTEYEDTYTKIRTELEVHRDHLESENKRMSENITHLTEQNRSLEDDKFHLESDLSKVDSALSIEENRCKNALSDLDKNIRLRRQMQLKADRYKQEIDILKETIDLKGQEQLKASEENDRLRKDIAKWQEECLLLDKQHKGNKRKVTLDLAQAREDLKESQEQLNRAEEAAEEARGEVLMLKEMIRTLQNQVKQKDKAEAQMRKKLDLRENFHDFG